VKATTTTKTQQLKTMLRVTRWEFERGNCVVVIRNYWRGEIGWVTEVQPELVRILLTIHWYLNPRSQGRVGVDY
jgi:hypothetical protein